jgi:Fur family ferric uptake transcriptional regulator
MSARHAAEPPPADATPAAGATPAGGATAQTIERARASIRERGMRWTPQRRLLVEVLLGSDGHVTGTELVDRCRADDPETTPSTVYRTLDALEEIGLVRHSHGQDGREEYHVLPASEHGHLRCQICGGTWEIDAAEAHRLMAGLARRRGFSVDLSHLTVVGTCATCVEAGAGPVE